MYDVDVLVDFQMYDFFMFSMNLTINAGTTHVKIRRACTIITCVKVSKYKRCYTVLQHSQNSKNQCHPLTRRTIKTLFLRTLLEKKYGDLHG
jgi:hypothetical protein